MKPILCLDFDGVIHSYVTPWTNAETIPDSPVPGAIAFLMEAVKQFRVAIYSSRSATANGRYAMREWLLKHTTYDVGEDLAIRLIDEIEWPTEKPPAFLTIDDRAITFTGAWPDMKSLLNFKPWNKSK